MAEQQRRFAIGYALAPKKRESFIQVSLVSLAQERGIDLIRIDTDKPLVDQGPFDCVLHKLYGDDWKKQLQEFSLKNPNARILDPPAAIERLHNRISMLQVVSELKVESHSNTFGIPKQIVIYDYETLGELQAWEPLKFPVIAKPLVADGSAKSHKMSLVFNQDGLNKSEQDQGSSSSIGQAQGSSSSTGQAQGLSFSVEARVMLPFLSILGFLLEVKSQDNNTLFEKHKAIIYSFVVAISIYMGTIFVGKKLGTEAIRPIQLLSGTIAAILLLLILVPNFGWLLLVLWVFLAAKMAWDYLPQLYHYLLSQEGGRVSNLLARLKTLNSTSVNGSQDDLV